MPRIFIPPALRPVVDGRDVVDVDAATVRQAVDELDRLYPGVKQRLCDGDELRSGTTVAVGGSVGSLGLLQRVQPDDEIHFLPAIGGG